jgi:type I restriction enzyme M protein
MPEKKKEKKKIECLKRKKLVVKTPEEVVRQAELRRLTEQLGYDIDDIEVEFKIKIGAGAKRADIAIFPKGKEHTQANVERLIECKREDCSRNDKKDGLLQLESYVSACMNCKFAMWVGEVQISYKCVVDSDSNRVLKQIATFPRYGKGKAKPPELKKLEPVLRPNSLLRSIHDYVHANEGLSKEKTFHELVKIIECKRADEAKGNPLKFYALPGESIKDIRKRIDELFDAVKSSQPEYGSERIEFNDNVLRYIVENMQLCSLTKTDSELIGKAYEELIGSNLRGDRGEYWTPGVVVKAGIEMLWALAEKDGFLDELVIPGSAKFIDPFTGTGRFPTYHLRKCRLELQSRDLDEGAIKDTIRNLTGKSTYAVDIQPQLVRTARSFISSNTGGSIAKVARADSLQTPIEDWDIGLTTGSITLGGTNPPFGDKLKIDDPAVLARYQLSTIGMAKDKHTGKPKSRNSVSPEVLSVERCVDLLNPGGYFAMVLPDAITNTKSKEYVRQYLLENVKLVACIDFPKETFVPGGTGTQTTLIIFQKPEGEENDDVDYESMSVAQLKVILKENNLPVSGKKSELVARLTSEEVFMAILTSVGYNQRDEKTFRTDEYGEYVLDSEGEEISDNQIPAMIKAFRAHLSLGDPKHSLFESLEG